MIRKSISIILMTAILVCLSACQAERPVSLTYAVYPYIPDADYYCEIIESRWAESEPDIQLVRAEYDCYTDGEPEGIDVIMYDAIMRDSLIENGWIQPLAVDDVRNADDIYDFAMDGLEADGQLYGIPVFLCGNFLIYDENSKLLADAEHITDLSDCSEILVMNSRNPLYRPQYQIEAIADLKGEANPEADDSADDLMKLIDQLAVDSCEQADDFEAAQAYDGGTGQGYIGFSESMRLLKEKAAETKIKAISFADRENVPRLYTDGAGVTAGVKGKKYDKCLELMNLMADAEVFQALSVQDGAPQYLLSAKKSPYEKLTEQFPLYEQLEKLAGDENNQIILTP